MTLYSYWASGASWRVRLTLLLKGWEYDKDIEYLAIDLNGDQYKEEYEQMNPAKLVPTLILRDPNLSEEDIIMSESLPICEFIEEVYPDRRKLLPENPIDRQKVRRLCEVINSNTQPIQNLAILQ